jgi:DNA topoisomerase-3
MEIDLRLGAAFTRFQTRRLQNRFEELTNSLISYGPCQFPTLGFVVERYLRRQNFQQENYWYITLEYIGVDETERASFQWDRGRLYDMNVCFVLYELCTDDGTAVVTSVSGKEKSRWAPLPLATVELQKRASRFLRMRSETTMKVAEELYQQGLISYPRTETDRFSAEFDIQGVLRELTGNPTWGDYATHLLDGGGFAFPRAGSNDDQAHPPITPMKSVDPATLRGDHRQIYELVTKHFLACCSRAAVGHETTVEVNIGGEQFKATGLMITERNWLVVYAPWEQWNSRTMPTFHQGQTFIPSELLMKEGLTQPPQLLNEAELIGEMDKKGIGTDATIAEHIKKIQEREYADRDGQDRFFPTLLGLALVEGYRAIGYSLDEPALRAAQEQDVARVARGDLSKQEAVDSCMATMREAFETCLQQAFKLDQAVGQRFNHIGMGGNADLVQANFSRCGCGGDLALKNRNGAGNQDVRQRFLQCSECDAGGLLLPLKGNFQPIQPPFSCPLCNYQVLQVVQGRGYEGAGYTLCPKCFRDPPEGHGGLGLDSFRCFQCQADCALAGHAGGDNPVAPCRICSGKLQLRKTAPRSYRLSCDKQPQGSCKDGLWLPKATSISVSQNECHRCTVGERRASNGCKSSVPRCLPPRTDLTSPLLDAQVMRLRFKFERGDAPPDVDKDLEDCVFCSGILHEIMGGAPTQVRNFARDRQANRLSASPTRAPARAPRASAASVPRNKATSKAHNPANSDYGSALLGKGPASRNATKSKGKRQPESGGRNHKSSGGTGPDAPNCNCRPSRTCTTILTVKKEGANKDRQFYKCHDCDFFAWVDEPHSSRAGGGRATSARRGGRGSASRGRGSY